MAIDQNEGKDREDRVVSPRGPLGEEKSADESISRGSAKSDDEQKLESEEARRAIRRIRK